MVNEPFTRLFSPRSLSRFAKRPNGKVKSEEGGDERAVIKAEESEVKREKRERRRRTREDPLQKGLW